VFLLFSEAIKHDASFCGEVRKYSMVADAAQLRISKNKADIKSKPLDFGEITAPRSDSFKECERSGIGTVIV
jgi:hypothetical protein